MMIEMTNPHAKWLLKAAEEIRKEGHTGWGNTCEQAAAEIARLIKADGLGGRAVLENCMALCGSCHRRKTHEQDRPIMAKADAQFKAKAGIKRKYKWPSRKFGS